MVACSESLALVVTCLVVREEMPSSRSRANKVRTGALPGSLRFIPTVSEGGKFRCVGKELLALNCSHLLEVHRKLPV